MSCLFLQHRPLFLLLSGGGWSGGGLEFDLGNSMEIQWENMWITWWNRYNTEVTQTRKRERANESTGGGGGVYFLAWLYSMEMERSLLLVAIVLECHHQLSYFNPSSKLADQWSMHVQWTLRGLNLRKSKSCRINLMYETTHNKEIAFLHKG